MSDKVLVGTVPNGEKFFSVERDGRKLPVLNGKGEVEFWNLRKPVASEFRRVLLALADPERLKVVS